jgi:hypothetical protein
LRSFLSTILLALVIPSSTIAPAQAPPRKSADASATAKSAPAAPCTCPPAPAAPAANFRPYTLKQENTRIQTLSGGATVRTVEETSLARDAQGRTFRETTRTQNGDVTQIFDVFDYVTQTRYYWTVSANSPKVVTVYRPRPNPNRPPPAAPPVAATRRYYPQTTETLPPQTIAGLYATGFLRKTTTPADYEGNDHDIVVSDELWNSPDLGIMLRRVFDDPRTGKNITETIDASQSDPDPTLFQPPSGFQLKDVNP